MSSEDFDALAVAGAVSRRALVGRLGGTAALAIGLGLLLTAAVSTGSPADRLGAAGGGLIAVTAGGVLIAVPWRVPIWTMDVMAASAGVILVGLGSSSATMQPALPAVYVIMGTVLFAIRSWRVAILHTSLLMLSYAVLLAIGPPVSERPARWVIVLSAVATSGVFIRWLVTRLSSLATDEHRAWREAEDAGAELARTSEIKSQFLARMSHELRTPLNVVIGFGHLLREGLVGPLNDQQREYVADICDSAAHLKSLVDDVLDHDKVEQGEVELLMETVDAGEVIDEAVRMVRESAVSRGVWLEADVAAPIAPIRADRRKLRQVVVNLLVNAVKFTPSGGVVAVLAQQRGQVLVITVRDTGIGIAPEDLDRIFEEYQQSARTTDGTGLGLPLARHFVELHGGRVWATSRPGVGSVFTVEIPYRSLARAMPAVHAAPSVDDSDAAFIVPGSRANRALVAFVGSWLSLNAAALLLVIALVSSLPTPRRWECVGLAAGSLLLGLTIRRSAHRLPLRGVEAFGALGIVAITVVTMYGGPFADLVPLAYGWVTMTTFALWPRRRAMMHLLGILVCYAAVVAVRADAHEAAQVVSILNVLLTSAAVSSWLLTKLRRLVSAEQTAHQRAQELLSRLDSASRHKGAFLANMSHELRTPLNAVIGFAELLVSGAPGPLTAKQREYAEDIVSSARHLLTLINDILDLAKLDAGQLTLSNDVVGVAALLDDVARRTMPTAQLRNISLDVRHDPDAQFVVGDSVRLAQVLDNLVSNALKFTPDGGGIELSASRRGELLVFTVRDTGIGVLPEQRHSIFESFSQGPQLAADRVPEGAGVGLSLVKGLVELHGGSVSVRSLPERGSEFEVVLPGVTADIPAMRATT